MLRGRAGHNINALHGEEPRIAHRRAVRRFRVAFRQLRQIDFIENGEAAQFRERIGRCDAGAGRNDQGKTKQAAGSHAHTSNGTSPGCKSCSAIAITFRK